MKYFIPLVLLCGCLQGGIDPVQPFSPDPIIIPPAQTEIPMLTAMVPGPLLASLQQYMGNQNTVTLKSMLDVGLDGNALHLPAGTNINYTLTPSLGTFSFGDPKPVLDVKIVGWDVHPSVNSVRLLPDNTGSVEASWGGITKTKQFKIAWADETPAPAAPVAAAPTAPVVELPELWMFCDPKKAKDGDTVCLPCRSAKKALKALAAEGKLPFKLMVKDKQADIPNWVEMYPTFYWGFDGTTPATSTVWKQQRGWTGAVDLVQKFNGLCVQLDKVQRAEIKATPPHAMSVGQLRWIAHTYTGPYTGVSGITAKQHLLQSKHGFTHYQVDPLTEWEAGQVHSWYHHNFK